MKVEQINSRKLFGEFGPRAPEKVPEGLKFLAKALLTFCIPAIAFAWVMNSSVLLQCLIVAQQIGVLCGLLLYKQPARPRLSCVPVNVNPTVPAKDMKKAA